MDNSDRELGLYPKYHVEKIVDKGNGQGTEPVNEWVFVMNPEKDPFAVEALWTYQTMARVHGFEALADDIRDRLSKLTADKS